MMMMLVVVAEWPLEELEIWASSDLLTSNVLSAREICLAGTELSQSWWVRLLLSLRFTPDLTCRGCRQLVFRSTYSPSLGTGTSPVN